MGNPPERSGSGSLIAYWAAAVCFCTASPAHSAPTSEIVGHVLRSVLCGLGHTFTAMMAHQMGKNELSAHFEAFLLERSADAGGSTVKAAPTFRTQVTTSMMRLEQLLRRPRFKDRWKREHGYTIAFEHARALCFPPSPSPPSWAPPASSSSR